MSAEQLASILAHAESLGIPEGTYISLSNKLKSLFDNTNNPITICKTLPHTMEFVGIDGKPYKLSVDKGTYSDSRGCHIQFKTTDEDGRNDTYTVGCPKDIQAILSLYQPVEIKLSLGGSHAVAWNYEKVNVVRKKEYLEHCKHNEEDEEEYGFNPAIEKFHLEVAAKFYFSIEYWIITRGNRLTTHMFID